MVENINENEKENENIKYEDNPEGVNISEFPKFIKLLPDGNYKIEMRKINEIKRKYEYFVLEDMDYRKLKHLIDRSKNAKGETVPEKLDELMIQNAIIYPEVTSDDLDEMKSSDMFRLKGAINLVYDIDSFLRG